MENNLAVIWDMDGTLIDAAELHCKAWQVVLKDYVPQYGWDDFMHGYSFLSLLHKIIYKSA
jgi:beta-phosphoglucomutase-like phosphatase (HAD superfamily)